MTTETSYDLWKDGYGSIATQIRAAATAIEKSSGYLMVEAAAATDNADGISRGYVDRLRSLASLLESFGSLMSTISALYNNDPESVPESDYEQMNAAGSAIAGTMARLGLHAVIGTDIGFTVSGTEWAVAYPSGMTFIADNFETSGLFNTTELGDGSSDESELVVGIDGEAYYSLGGGNDIFVPGSGNYTIDAGDGNDIVVLGAGGGSVSGGNGNDNLIGGAGGDTLKGDAGDDYLTGNAGNDKLSGGDGNDTLRGDAGNDILSGGDGNDNLNGSDGDDELSGDNGDDMLTGGAGNDTLKSGAGNDLLFGDDGNDYLYGGAGIDTLFGGEGDDTFLIAGGGKDTVDGGEGSDTISFALSGNGVTVNLLNPEQSSGGDAASIGSLVSIENIIGSNKDDTLSGDEQDNTLNGGNGNDKLDGGAGADRLFGGKGNDIYCVDSLDDNVFELAGQGTDTVIATASYMLRDNYVENLTLAGIDDIDATGNDRDNTITGNAGDNRLTGGAGKDMFVFQADGSHDTVNDFTDGADIIKIVRLTNVGDRFEYVNNNMDQVGNNVVINLDDSIITLVGVNMNSLSASDFVFG